MYSIKRIVDEDIYKFFKLHYKLQELLPVTPNRLVSSMLLLDELKKPSMLALGLYKNTTLVGFINGYEETEDIYFFANIYVENSSRHKVKALMLLAENIIISNGYKQWKSTSLLEEGRNILTRFGGTKQ